MAEVKLEVRSQGCGAKVGPLAKTPHSHRLGLA